MDLVALKSFLIVAELGSFSRAAEQLHLAQPAVSQQIKRLERDLGAELLKRSTRRVELTPVGAALVPRAQSILADVQRARTEVSLMQAGSAGKVAVGFVGTATYDLLPEVSRSAREHLPAVELELFGEQLTPVLLDALRSRRLDIAVMRDPMPDPMLDLRPLRSEGLVAAMPVDHPCAQGDSVALGDLRDSTLITHPSGHQSVTYDAVMQACRRAGFLPDETVEVRETATMVAFVAAGIGVALVPGPVRSLPVEGVAYRPLADLDYQTQLVLATRTDDVSAPVARVVDLIIESAQPQVL